MSDPGETKPRRVLPPVFFLAALVAMGALHELAPGTRLIWPPYTYLGWIAFAAGVIAAVAVKRRFDRAGISIKPNQVPEHLVTDGLFAYSRNPVYASMILGLAGIFVVLGTLTPALVVPVFAYLISVRFIALEERLLEDRFGDAYRDYAGRVRRWI
ncbi:MAG: isoprenylcysteine carboxylmethyltransferase family protein [Proteobacteria bacterium]|nr:isoprenylcysteine carboxylmethyltransferase family protein [Pseudomonadota bacterium]